MKKTLLFLLILLTCFTFIWGNEIDNYEELSLLSFQIARTLENEDFNALAQFIDPKIGLYFTDLINISSKFSNHLSYEEVQNIESDTTKRPLFCNDAEPWVTTVSNYFSSAFAKDLKLLEKISFNKYYKNPHSSELGYEEKNNLINYFEDSIFIEFYYRPSGRYGDIDWQSTYFIFKKINNEFKLVGLSRTNSSNY